MHPFSRLLIVAVFCFASTAIAQDDSEVLAVADEALVRISNEDSTGLAALMIPEAMVYVGLKQEDATYAVRTRSFEETRDRVMESDLEERGWDPTVLVSGTIAIVWYPYDIYVDGKWSHCGVDIFRAELRISIQQVRFRHSFTSLRRISSTGIRVPRITGLPIYYNGHELRKA